MAQNSKKTKRNPEEDEDCRFNGDKISIQEAKKRWPHRYLSKSKWALKSQYNIEWHEEQVLQAKCHYTEAIVDGVVIKLLDDVYIQGDGELNYIGKVVEFFETVDKEQFLTAQWFYRAQDTVIKNHSDLINQRRVFLSEVKDDNPLGCVVRKVHIAAKPLNGVPDESAELFCDMKYQLPFFTFTKLMDDAQNDGSDSDTASTISSDHSSAEAINDGVKDTKSGEVSAPKGELNLLDLYCGCGAMSTGLCLGATLSGVKLVNRWAVDANENACETIRKNHPETLVRNELAEEFLALLKEWERLCNELVLSPQQPEEVTVEEEDSEDDSGLAPGEFEVERLVDICYVKNRGGLNFKVRWKGYESDEDSWEPIDGLSGSEERIKEFVQRGYNSKILPLPGDVDFLCGGPPCQGVSGHNRFREAENPLKDDKNKQLLVFMDIVNFLKPKYVLMENVVDLVKFSDGYLGRYAIGKLVDMNYQTRIGIMAAGSYGLPQYRLRVFLWGALPSKLLPQYPLPTHEAVVRGGTPVEFEESFVTYGKNNTSVPLEKALLLKDAISDLPPVTNFEEQSERPYDGVAHNDFQRYIRLKREEIIGFDAFDGVASDGALYDHVPYQCNDDDYLRVCRIPKKKGANFRDLPGVKVDDNGKVYIDPLVERELLPSTKPLVPNYAISFVKGCSKKPFGRLWWDETVSTVVTRPEPHNQRILHPEQDRVLTVRENARLQGFLDCFKLYGNVKERYIQVGNAVAIPVGIALGYTFGLAAQGLADEKPLTTLPFKFPNCLARQ